MIEYKLPEQLIAKIMTVLDELPARVSRSILNEIEMTCAAQLAASKAAANEAGSAEKK